ncbi:response regulator [Cohnella ginsengisoli]|uniref:Response regulator n=1 Tax=Cohnella ginsengisoli TaxID=425004 RepID=A0A9X4QN44_9BACL|nr:response regulator [Cohnella ginsengisoli]MDG0791540.1 response regulator [Cohnella ginsengisoli]
MRAAQTIKVVVIEDEQTIRDYIARKIERTAPAFKVVGSTYNGADGLALIRRLQPDAVFTDIRMPMMDGIEMLDLLRTSHPDLPVVILSGFDEFEYARQAMRYGVFEYMLKPLSEDVLKQTLSKLADLVYSRQRTLARQMITSRLIGAPEGEASAFESGAAYLMCLIGIGSLCTPTMSVSLAHRFNERWAAIDWDAAVADWMPGARGWWLIDENRSNQKFLIVSADSNAGIALGPVADKLPDRIGPAAAPFGVTASLCVSPDAASMWETAQRMRIAFERSVVIGHSKVYTELEAAAPDSSVQLIGSKVTGQIRLLLDTANRESLRRFLSDLFEDWDQKKYPQRLVEQGILDLLAAVQQHPLAHRDSVDWHAWLGEQISLGVNLEQIGLSVWALIETMLPDEKKEQTEALADMIEQYLLDHFTEDISLEGLAKKFGFTSAYLSKIFRKYKNESPLRYMIGLRIAEAKRLMLEHPDLDSRIIAEMVGYLDQHYFSKVFKNVVGQTSTEFRQSLTAT